jgi:MFS transporter, FHS family, glucose/mannose:H+ symporter
MNAAVLAVSDKDKLTQMAGILTFFSALGGTLGSKITGVLFEKIGGNNAFYFALIPMALLAFFLFILYKKTNHEK